MPAGTNCFSLHTCNKEKEKKDIYSCFKPCILYLQLHVNNNASLRVLVIVSTSANLFRLFFKYKIK